MTFAILLLAAGPSSRMGQSKQLLKINGETLLEKSVRVALEVSSEVYVVLGASFEIHRQAIKALPVTIIENKAWEKGMGHSLKVGLANLISSKREVDAVLVLVCDQPLLSAEHLNAILAEAKSSGNAVIASAYAGTVGVPALFTRSMFGKLSSLGDSEGAKKVIRESGNAVATVDFSGGATDLDTAEDVSKFLRS